MFCVWNPQQRNKAASVTGGEGVVKDEGGGVLIMKDLEAVVGAFVEM